MIEHRLDRIEDRCTCGGMIVYFEDGDRDGRRGEGCEVADVVFPKKDQPKPVRRTPSLYD